MITQIMYLLLRLYHTTSSALTNIADGANSMVEKEKEIFTVWIYVSSCQKKRTAHTLHFSVIFMLIFLGFKDLFLVLQKSCIIPSFSQDYL